MPFETLFQVDCRTRSQGSKTCQNGHMLSLSGLLLVHLCTDFEISLHSCCPRGGDVPYATFFSGRLNVKVKGVK